MTYITIDTKTKQAQKLVELLETLPFAKVLRDPDAATKKALELLVAEDQTIPEWQKQEVRKIAKEVKENRAVLVDEDIVFAMLNKD
jgi:hypothetical protein